MRNLFLILAIAMLAGCSSTPKVSDQELIIDKQIQPLGRNETITAVRECETNGLRAVMLYGKRKVNGYTTESVVDVSCAPKW